MVGGETHNKFVKLVDGVLYLEHGNGRRHILQRESSTPLGSLQPDRPRFVFHDTPKNWDDAKAACEAEGMHLATITSQEDNDAVKAMIGNSSSWIGYNDKEFEGSWGWESGSDSSFTNWYGNEPNNQGNEDCTQMYVHNAATAGKWNDNQCTHRMSYVCSRD